MNDRKTRPRWLRMKIIIPVGITTTLLLFACYLGVLSAMATRPTNLGVHDGRLNACPASPNCVCSFTSAADKEHSIAPLAFMGSVAEAKERIKQILSRIPRMKVVTEEDNYLHVEATSWLFRFVDDVEFYFDEPSGLIHFRSASRVGYSDLGANRARLENIRKAWK